MSLHTQRVFRVLRRSKSFFSFLTIDHVVHQRLYSKIQLKDLFECFISREFQKQTSKRHFHFLWWRFALHWHGWMKLRVNVVLFTLTSIIHKHQFRSSKMTTFNYIFLLRCYWYVILDGNEKVQWKKSKGERRRKKSENHSYGVKENVTKTNIRNKQTFRLNHMFVVFFINTFFIYFFLLKRLGRNVWIFSLFCICSH